MLSQFTLTAPAHLPKYPARAMRAYGEICAILAGRASPRAYTAEEWRLIGQVAEREAVAPLLHAQQRHGWLAAIPGALRQHWARSYYNTVAQNRLFYRELESILDALAAAGIPVIVLKGAVLGWSVYPDIGLRPMSDLDLLILPEHIEPALHTLKRLGYTEADVEITGGINRQLSHNVDLRGGPGGRLGVELHWNLIAGEADDRSVPADWFWGQVALARGVPYFSNPQLPLPHLHPTAHLLYVAAHLVLRHGGAEERLIWFYDIDRLVRAGGVDWESLAAQAHALGWGALLRYVLGEAHTYLDTPLPAGLPGRLAGEAEWGAFLKQLNVAVARVSRLERTWGALGHLQPGMRLRLLAALVFPSPAYMRWRYKVRRGWLPLYYARRWLEISGEFVRGLFPAGRRR